MRGSKKIRGSGVKDCGFEVMGWIQEPEIKIVQFKPTTTRNRPVLMMNAVANNCDEKMALMHGMLSASLVSILNTLLLCR